MEKNMSQIISIKAMLASLFDRADTSERGLSCCKCFVDNGKFIVGGDFEYNAYSLEKTSYLQMMLLS